MTYIDIDNMNFDINHYENKDKSSDEISYFTLKDFSSITDKDNNFIPSDFDIDSRFAKRKISANEKHYFIRVDNTGKLFNPLSYKPEIKNNRVIIKMSQANNFIKVSEDVFNTYLKFLRTKNELWLNQAERNRF